MKDYIVQKHEVKLDGTWCEVNAVVDTENKIMFHDPRQQPAPAAGISAGISSAIAPTPGAFSVNHLMIYKGDPYYRTSRTMRVLLNQDLDIVAKLKAKQPEPDKPSPGCFYATIVLD